MRDGTLGDVAERKKRQESVVGRERHDLSDRAQRRHDVRVREDGAFRWPSGAARVNDRRYVVWCHCGAGLLDKLGIALEYLRATSSELLEREEQRVVERHAVVEADDVFQFGQPVALLQHAAQLFGVLDETHLLAECARRYPTCGDALVG